MRLMIVKSMDIRISLEGVITSVIGPSNSGKTYFLKKLCNKIDNQDIIIDGNSIKLLDIDYLKKNLAVVLDDDYFNTNSVKGELVFYLKKLGYSNKEIKERLEEFSEIFKLKDILKLSIYDLTLEKKILVKILSLLIIKPKIFAIDNLVGYLSKSYQDILFKYIKEQDMNFINITSNPEDLLRSDDVVVLNDFKAIYCDNAENLVIGNSILPYMGMKMPFIADLSQNLILYGLIDKVYLSKRKLVDKLWK